MRQQKAKIRFQEPFCHQSCWKGIWANLLFMCSCAQFFRTLLMAYLAPLAFLLIPNGPPKKCQKKKLAQHGFYRLLFTGPSKANLGLYGFLSMWNKPQKKMLKKKLAQHGFYKLLIPDPSKGNLGLCGFLSMWIKPQKKMQRKKLAQDDFYKLLIRGPSKGNLGL